MPAAPDLAPRGLIVFTPAITTAATATSARVCHGAATAPANVGLIAPDRFQREEKPPAEQRLSRSIIGRRREQGALDLGVGHRAHPVAEHVGQFARRPGERAHEPAALPPEPRHLVPVE